MTKPTDSQTFAIGDRVIVLVPIPGKRQRRRHDGTVRELVPPGAAQGDVRLTVKCADGVLRRFFPLWCERVSGAKKAKKPAKPVKKAKNVVTIAKPAMRAKKPAKKGGK